MYRFINRDQLDILLPQLIRIHHLPIPVMPGKSDHATSLLEIAMWHIHVHHDTASLDLVLRDMPQFIKLGKSITQMAIILPSNPLSFLLALLRERIPQIHIDHFPTIMNTIKQNNEQHVRHQIHHG